LLGPFEVTEDGRRIELTAGRLRSMLAALAIAAGRPVTVGRLAAAMWDADPPEDVRRTVRTYVTRLRAAVGAELIGTEPQGYALRVEPGQVDALMFLRLTDQVQRLQDRAQQRAALCEALGLWRGSPFEGVSSRWLAQTSAPQLVERYLAAVERRMDLDIGEQRLAGLVAELTELIARFPLRESLWVRLLVVLEHGGRPAEALSRYEQVRVRLAEELGADPGPQLQRVYSDLLAGRRPQVDAGGPEPGGPGRPARNVPEQLPADLDTFVGRARQLAALDALLPAAGAGAPGGLPVGIVHGPAGAGKTALAVHWAQRVKERFPDGQLYLNLRGYAPGGSALTAVEAVRCLLDALQVPAQQIPADLPGQAGLYRSRLSGTRTLILLDNARDADQVRLLLPGAAGCLVVVTSRNQLTGLVAAECARPVPLDLLPAQEAEHLLARRLGQPRVAAEPDAVAEIIEYSSGLPLALAIVAARAATNPTFPLSALAAELRDTHGRLDAFAAADAATDLRAVFTWSYRTLSPAAARLFRLLALHTGPDITAAAAGFLAGTPPREARLLLDELAVTNLVGEHKPGRYVLHDLLRAYAAELVAEQHDTGERARSITRVLGFYLATTWRTVPLLSPGDCQRLRRADGRWRAGGLELADEAAALRWLDIEHDTLLAAVRQAVDTPGVPERIAVQLAHALFAYFSVRPRWDDWARVNEIAVDAADRFGDRPAFAQATYDLGFVCWLRGRFAEAGARYGESLAIFRELADQGGEAACLAGLGDVYRVQGCAEQATARYEESLAICRRLGDLRGQTMSLGSLGLLYQGQGRSAEAQDCLRESLAIRDQLGDRRGKATSLSNLGAFYQREGRYEEALTCYQQSLATRREQGDRHGEATSLAGVGAVYREIRRLDRALSCQRESVAIFRSLADAQCLAENLRGLAETLQLLGRGEEADAHRQEALEIFGRLGTPDADPAAPAAAA
jgi:DNA-binding SARP family transcriptional activator/tetratricopeptide (TPR) repeat protein